MDTDDPCGSQPAGDCSASVNITVI